MEQKQQPKPSNRNSKYQNKSNLKFGFEIDSVHEKKTKTVKMFSEAGAKQNKRKRCLIPYVLREFVEIFGV